MSLISRLSLNLFIKHCWFRSGVQNLEQEKTIPSGTGNSLLSLQHADPNALSKICKTISKEQNADLKPSDCNSLQGNKAEEIKWIIAGWTAGKILQNNNENNHVPNVTK
jgi:hypothetical protein